LAKAPTDTAGNPGNGNWNMGCLYSHFLLSVPEHPLLPNSKVPNPDEIIILFTAWELETLT
jgi:hypothetical protein